jgi:hypothetical protein
VQRLVMARRDGTTQGRRPVRTLRHWSSRNAGTALQSFLTF